MLKGTKGTVKPLPVEQRIKFTPKPSKRLDDLAKLRQYLSTR